MTDNEGMKATLTASGNSIHLTEDGNKTLCGREAWGTLQTDATCDKCRKAAGLSYWVWKGSQRIQIHA